MNPAPDRQPDIGRLHDLARARAQQLRRETMSRLWQDLDDALEAGADRATRAARRLAHRLRHHRLLRQANAARDDAS